MPIQRCALAGRPGWRWGEWGHCYVYGSGTGRSESVAKQKARLESGIVFPSRLVQRITDQGLTDPNAKAKDATEIELSAIIVAVFGRHLKELLRRLGTPPDWSKIPTSLWPRWEKELAQEVRPVLDRAALTAGERLILVQNFPVERKRVIEGARRWSVTRSLLWAAGVVGSSRRALWDRITRYLAEEGRNLSEDINFYFSQTRAEVEAVTETTHAFAQGERIVVEEFRKQPGISPGDYTIQTEAVWHTMRDPNVCLACRERDNEPEGNWGIMPEFPPLHYRCRCWVTYAGFGDVPLGRHFPGEDIPRVGQF